MPTRDAFSDIRVLESRMVDHDRRLDELEEAEPKVVAAALVELREEVKTVKRDIRSGLVLLIVGIIGGLITFMLQHAGAASTALHLLFGSLG